MPHYRFTLLYNIAIPSFSSLVRWALFLFLIRVFKHPVCLFIPISSPRFWSAFAQNMSLQPAKLTSKFFSQI